MSTNKIKIIGVGTGTGGVGVDTTLAYPGKAADAKSTGDAIKVLQEKLDNIAIDDGITALLATKADVDHTHIAADVGADEAGAAASALSDARSYTDTKISDLINGAPTTLDTLGEIADAMKNNSDVVEALDAAIGSKASASDLSAHISDTANPHKVTLGQLGVTTPVESLNYLDGVNKNIQVQFNEISDLVGDKAVSDQIDEALTKYTQDGILADTGATSVEVTGDGNAVTAASYDESTRKLTLTKGATYNNYTLPTAGSELGGVKTTSNVTSASGLTACPIIDGVPYYKDTDTSYSLDSFGVTATAEEINYVSGATKNIQEQLDDKVPVTRTINGKALSSDITLTVNDLGLDMDDTTDAVLSQAKDYTDSTIAAWVGDETVANQISSAIADINYPVDSVNGKTGVVVLTASDVGADVSGAANTALENAKDYTDQVVADITHPVNSVNGKTGAVTLIASDVGADSSGSASAALASANDYTNKTVAAITHPVESVNGKTGVVILSAADIGADESGAANTALTNAKSYIDSEMATWVGDSTVANQISSSLTSAKSYTDEKIGDLINGAPTTLDTLGEIATAMSENATVVEKLDSAIGSKANAADLTSHITNKANPHDVTLAQLGVSVTAEEINYVDGATSNIQTQLNNMVPQTRTINGKSLSADIVLTAGDLGVDVGSAAEGMLSEAKSYTDSEIGEWVGDKTVSTQISSAIAGIDYPVDSVNGKTGIVVLSASDVGADNAGSAESALTNARSYTDEKVASKANAEDLTAHISNKSNPHNVTLAQLGVSATATELNYVDGVTQNIQTQIDNKVPTTRTINGKPLSADITLTAGDLGVDMGSASDAVLTSAKAYTDSEIAEWVGDATVSSQISSAISDIDYPVDSVNGKVGVVVLSAGDVGADASGSANTALVNAKDYTDKAIAAIAHPVVSVNGKTGAVVLSASDVGALPATTAIPSIDGLATKTYVNEAVADVVNSAPEALNTLNELAAALGNDANFATTIATQLGVLETKIGDEPVADQISAALETKSDVGHTHNYAGSSSAGGAANSANKLNTNAGSETHPVYFENGVPVKTTYALGANVPSDAKFTDTVYTHPGYTSRTSGLYKVSVDNQGHVSAATAVTKSDITSLGIPAQDTTYGAATVSAAGLMTADMVTKLNSIATGANNITVDAALSSSSTNPVQNKVVNAAISNLNTLVGDTAVATQISAAIADKADIGHAHTASDVGADESGSADRAYSYAKSYTDEKIAALINSAPTTLDTLGEIAAAMEENADVVEALETAIGKKSDVGHTHSYAGSSSVGGAATSANKLNTNAGDATHPVYFANGVPVATSYTLGASVPSGAKFTDTTYSVATQSDAGLMSAADKKTLDDLDALVGDTSVSSQIAEAIANKSDSNHTHNYAGSSSVGGAATSANKLNTNAGSATQPVYFANGIPVVTTYTLEVSVPSGAKFTDTVYTHPTTSGNKHIPSGGSSGQILRWSSDGTAVWGADNNTTYSVATTTSEGLMSAADKTALDTLSTLVGDTAVATQIADAIDDVVVGLSVSGKIITYTKGDGSTGTITTQDTDTTYSAGTGISLSGTTFSNSGVHSVTTGSTNGTISVNTNGTSADVAVKGLGSAAYTASTAYDAAGAANTALTNAKAYTDSEIAEWVGDATVASQISTAVSAITYSDVGAAAASHTHSNYAASNHTHSYLPLSGGSLTGTTTAASTAVGTSGIRNIHAGTSALTSGSSSLATGAIYIQYE